VSFRQLHSDSSTMVSQMSFQSLVDGAARFCSDVFPQKATRFAELAGGQAPQVLFITCSDSRIVPSLVLQAEPGELFVLRTAGNIVPRYDAAVGGGEAATIEYAVMALKVPHIVVCGHSRCGAMSALLDPSSTDSLPAVKALLAHDQDVLAKVGAGGSQDSESQLLRVIEQNVLQQLENLHTHPSVRAAVEEGSLQLHGWVYHFESGRLTSYAGQQQGFQPLAEPGSPSTA